jgi:hypothetical protein
MEQRHPFIPFNEALLEALTTSGHRYFVLQTFAPGKTGLQGEVHKAFLLTHYADVAQARAHYEMLARDKSRSLYDVSLSENLERLRRLAKGIRWYPAFSPKMEMDTEPADMVTKIEEYIRQKRP